MNADKDNSRATFCDFLRSHRQSAEMSLEEIARITKIPARSLRCLEDGRFEELPGDVFVRGFLRSYARCVGFDAEDAVKRYAVLGLAPSPVASEEAKELAAELASSRPAPNDIAPDEEEEAQPASLRSTAAPSVAAEHAGESNDEEQRPRSFLPSALFEDEGSRRGQLTLAVIILVIVATLTMSYLLRRPSYSGDGVTMRGEEGVTDLLA